MEEATTSKLPPKVLGTQDSSRVLLCDFKDLSVKSLAKAGQLKFHHYITVMEAFPFPNSKEECCWKSIVQASTSSGQLKATLDSVEGDTTVKWDLIDYVSPFSFSPTKLIQFVL